MYLPAETYRTGALRLHSDIALYLDEDAVLQGTDMPEDYLPRVHSRFEGTEMECYSSLLNLGEMDHTSDPNCHDVLIYGKDTIASGGQALATRIIDSERERLRDYLATNIVNRPSKHIRVFNCVSRFGHGICIDSEMYGGIEDVGIWDSDLANSSSGIEIKATKKRGGYVRDIWVRDCSSPRVMIHSVGYNDDGVPAPQPPVLENFRFEHLHLTGRALNQEWFEVVPIELAGFNVSGHELRGVVFSDCVITGGLPMMPTLQRHDRRRVGLLFMPSF